MANYYGFTEEERADLCDMVPPAYVYGSLRKEQELDRLKSFIERFLPAAEESAKRGKTLCYIHEKIPTFLKDIFTSKGYEVWEEELGAMTDTYISWKSNDVN